MKIKVKDESESYTVGFLFGRMYIFNNDRLYYRTETNYCPHFNVGYGECHDCALVIDEED